MSRWSQPVAIGQRYASADQPMLVWEVQKVFTATDGMEYVMLNEVGDRTRRKTVSCSAVQDSRLFKLIMDSRI
jgi:hypothetical protein